MTEFRYRKSRYSGSNGDCVEVAGNVPGVRAVRDSTDPTGPHLEFSPAAFATFLTAVKAATTDPTLQTSRE